MSVLSRAALVGVLAWVPAALVGCSGEEGAGSSTRPPVELSRLPGAMASENRELREELRRVTAAEATPMQLVRQPPPKEDNAAVALRQVWTKVDFDRDSETAQRLFPAEEFRFRPAELAAAAALCDKYAAQMAAARSALHAPGVRLWDQLASGPGG